MSSVSVQDAFGLVYLVENPQQFWSALEDVLLFPTEYPTLSMLDSALHKYIELSAAYHEQYLQSPLQLDHACKLLLDSELFTFHSDRMCDILFDEAKTTTDPHRQLIVYHILSSFGKRKPDFLKAHKRWRPVLPFLMDHILVDVDPSIEDTYFGAVSHIPTPIEVKLRSLAVKVLYEVCRVQKPSPQDIAIFTDSFVEHLFDLVEQTRHMQDDSFNYSIIKLIVALNEQYMVAALQKPDHHHHHHAESSDGHRPNENNRVLHILLRRLGQSQTFGENIIFMLNRAGRTSEDLCMQLLVLKLLYLLFTTHGTEEFFYTNDLRVLVDVFLRELVDLDEDSESLRHTYLRVLHPLLTKTQLRDHPYKRSQIVYALESLLSNPRIRDINPTTKRLAERCLSGPWCIQFRQSGVVASPVSSEFRVDSPSHVTMPSPTAAHTVQPGPGLLPPSLSNKKSLKTSKSMEFHHPPKPIVNPYTQLDNVRRSSNASTTSFSGVTSAALSPPPRPTARRKGSIVSEGPPIGFRNQVNYAEDHRYSEPIWQDPQSPVSPVTSTSEPTMSPHVTRRSPPPVPPVKRRKPPAVPIRTKLGTKPVDLISIKASHS